MISPPLPHLQELPEWTPRRQQLYGRLAERAAPLAGMYASGVFFLASPTWPGRYHLLGHCVREIVQRLPEFLDPQPRSRALWDTAVNSFVDAWLGAGLPTTGMGLGSFASEPQEDDRSDVVNGRPAAGGAVAVPSSVAEAAGVLVVTHEQMSVNNYDKAASIILARPAADAASLIDQTPTARDATVLLWTKTATWFLKLTHVSASQDEAAPDEAELQHQFEIIESTLEAILAPFYQVIDDLDAILDSANAPAVAGAVQEEIGAGTSDREVEQRD
jgi:hypothetical protein